MVRVRTGNDDLYILSYGFQVGVPDQHHFGNGVHLILRDAVCYDRFRLHYPAFHSGNNRPSNAVFIV